jgi:hypothetical protein
MQHLRAISKCDLKYRFSRKQRKIRRITFGRATVASCWNFKEEEIPIRIEILKHSAQVVKSILDAHARCPIFHLW